MTPWRRRLAPAALASWLGLAALACSRGGDDGTEAPAPGPSSTAPPPSTPAPGAPPTPPPAASSSGPAAPPPAGSGPAPLPPPAGATPPAGPAGELFALVNEARTAARPCGAEAFAAAPPLRWSDALARAAQAHGDDMAAKNYFDHDSPGGKTPGDRVADEGYAFAGLGENIAAGQATPAAAMATWLASAGHCVNLMNPAFRDFGAGRGEGGTFGVYWTQVFATPAP